MSELIKLVGYGYILLGSRIFLEKIDEAEKNDEFVEFDPLHFVYITRLKQIINILVTKTDLQLLKAVLQLFPIYQTISILIYKHNKISTRPWTVDIIYVTD